jgi:hypothetical protein
LTTEELLAEWAKVKASIAALCDDSPIDPRVVALGMAAAQFIDQGDEESYTVNCTLKKRDDGTILILSMEVAPYHP